MQKNNSDDFRVDELAILYKLITENGGICKKNEDFFE